MAEQSGHGRPLLWLCGCCALIETTWLDDDDTPRCSLCKFVCPDGPCLVLKWVERQVDVLVDPSEEA